MIQPWQSLQSALDGAKVDDVIELAPGTWQGPIHVRSRVSLVSENGAVIAGNGTIDPAAATVPSVLELHPTAAGMTLQGVGVTGGRGVGKVANLLVRAPGAKVSGVTSEDSEGWAVRVYETPGILFTGLTARHAGQAIEFHGNCDGTVLDGYLIEDVDRMMLDDPAPGNDYGGDAISFFRTIGVTARNGIINRARSKHSYDFGSDGGAWQFWEGCQRILIEDSVVTDCENVVETGKGSAAAPDPTNVVIQRIKAYGVKGRAPTDVLKSVGMLVRSAVRWSVTDSEFHDLDWWVLDLDKGSKFDGGIDGFDFRRNKLWLSGFAAYAIAPGVPYTVATIDENEVYFDASQPYVAQAPNGRTSSLAEFRQWSGYESRSTWGPPPDPCAADLLALQGQYDQLLRDAATAAQDAATTLGGVQGRLDAANGKIVAAHTEALRVVSELNAGHAVKAKRYAAAVVKALS